MIPDAVMRELRYIEVATARKMRTPRRSAATPPSTLNKNYLPLLRALRKVASVGDLFFGSKADGQRTLSLW